MNRHAMRKGLNNIQKLIWVVCVLLYPSVYITGQTSSGKIQLNQAGFYPLAPKVAVIAPAGGNHFFILGEKRRDTVYRGLLSEPKQSANSSLTTRVADFSPLQTEGKYILHVVGLGDSYPFLIGNDVHGSVASSSLKAFYYQRASMALEKKYAGQWARSAGHPDTAVLIHPSAATAKRPAGMTISSRGGWYDAGDYNKYIVNSGITMGTLLSAYEDFSSYFAAQNIFIPGSNDEVPDILDEVLYNLRWMLMMQDPDDGGVYNKCTNAGFDGMVMPEVTGWPRYVVQKGTAATLDFAAVMAQASRIFSKFKKQFPGLSDSCLRAAQSAWLWAEKNPSLVYDQQAMNKQFEPAISTGGYGDRNFTDEWYWAAAELFVTTSDKKYYSVLEKQAVNFSLPSWGSVGMLGYYTLLRKRESLPRYCSPVLLRLMAHVVHFADSLLYNSSRSAFRTVMGGSRRDFVWGSNAVAANQGIALINAWLITRDKKYIAGALTNLDYLLGRNATGYCFVTGAGSKSPMHIHHRPSSADGIVQPVPGLLAGGPNPGRQDKCEYTLTEPETCYADIECSYASNEIAINWNSPLVYLANAIEALQYAAGYAVKTGGK